MPLLRLICCILVFLPALVVSGCNTTSVIDQIATPPETVARTQPIRTLRVLVVYDNQRDLESIKKSLGEASRVLKKQIGVELELSPTPALTNWEGGRVTFDELKRVSDNFEHTFDVSIGFGSKIEKPEDWVWAQNENVYRRFIISEKFFPWLLAHELGHSFIFCHEHSTSGLMQAKSPLILSADDYLFTKEDLEEVFRNKWRKFNERVRCDR